MSREGDYFVESLLGIVLLFGVMEKLENNICFEKTMNEHGGMMNNIDEILQYITTYRQRMTAEDNCEKVVILAIDGRAASGKTTLAQKLSEITEAGVIHMDDFFLPMELRTKQRLAQPGGNVHYERFAEEILSKLNRREAFAYRRFDCGKMQLGEEQVVPEVQSLMPLRIVEGAYSCHPVFGDYADIKIFSDVESTEQFARILRRNGEEKAEKFRSIWIPMEESYFTEYEILEAADIVV